MECTNPPLSLAFFSFEILMVEHQGCLAKLSRRWSYTLCYDLEIRIEGNESLGTSFSCGGFTCGRM